MIDQETLKNALEYDSNTGVFVRLISGRGRNSRIGDVAGMVDKDGYIRISILGKKYQAHRLAWLYVYGKWPDMHIDHINGVREDNRIENLRDVDMTTNIQNLKKAMISNKSCGLLGVSFDANRKKFRAQIKYEGRKISIGMFDSPEDAHQAYLVKKRQLHEGCTI